jgi:hypothetical protein
MCSTEAARPPRRDLQTDSLNYSVHIEQTKKAPDLSRDILCDARQHEFLVSLPEVGGRECIIVRQPLATASSSATKGVPLSLST